MEDDKKISTGKEFAGFAADLTDEEIKDTVQVINLIRTKWSGKSNTAKNLENMRDEILTRLAEKNILATLDPAPCLYGEPPTVEIIGKVGGSPDNKYGMMDHEKKRFEVIEANRRNEDYRGQKERYNSGRKK